MVTAGGCAPFLRALGVSQILVFVGAAVETPLAVRGTTCAAQGGCFRLQPAAGGSSLVRFSARLLRLLADFSWWVRHWLSPRWLREVYALASWAASCKVSSIVVVAVRYTRRNSHHGDIKTMFSGCLTGGALESEWEQFLAGAPAELFQVRDSAEIHSIHSIKNLRIDQIRYTWTDCKFGISPSHENDLALCGSCDSRERVYKKQSGYSFRVTRRVIKSPSTVRPLRVHSMLHQPYPLATVGCCAPRHYSDHVRRCLC
jgi:hypothetical protein